MTARTLEPFDPAIVAPWRLGDGPRGALLLHGFAGTPPELRRLGEHLARHGWRCHAPALPGHATVPEDLEHVRWTDWADASLAALDELAQSCETVVVAGQSMGGALALHVAANDLRVAAVASLATPLRLKGVLHHLIPAVKQVVRWHRPGGDVDLWDQHAVEELHSYGLRSLRAIHELKKLIAAVRDEVAQIRAPVLVLHGGRDSMADPRGADELVQRLVCSEAVEKHVLARSGHAISVDVDRDEINALVLRWFERWAGSPQARVPEHRASGF
jgi:carboxylesterase